MPDQEWLRKTNAAVGPYTDQAGTPAGAEAEELMRAFIANKWPTVIILDLDIVTTPQAPGVVLEALDALLPEHRKEMIRREGNSLLAVVVDPEDYNHAWLLLIVELEDGGTALHIVEMRNEPKEEQG